MPTLTCCLLQEHRQKGLMTAVLTELVAEVLQRFTGSSVFAFATPRNAASQVGMAGRELQ